MATMYFVRHGKTVMNKNKQWSGLTDCELSQEGREEVRRNFENYTAKDFDVYYCSPLKRTVQTLDEIVEGQTPIIDPRIIERCFGDWEGQPFSILTEAETERYIKGEIQPPNGESYEEVKERVVSFVSDMQKKYQNNERILVVSHATILRMVRDVFLPDMPKGPIKNSQLIVLELATD